MKRAVLLFGSIIAAPVVCANIFGQYYVIPGLSDITPVIGSYRINDQDHYVVMSHRIAYQRAKLAREAEQAIKDVDKAMDNFYKGMQDAGIPVVKTEKERDELLRRVDNVKMRY